MTDPAPHLLHVFSTFVPAGPEMRTVRIMNAAGARYRHSVLAVDGRASAAEHLEPETPARVLPSLPRAGTPRTVLRLRRLLRELRPDLLLTYNFGAFDALLAARSLGLRRVVHHEDGFNADEALRFKRRRVWLRRVVLPHVPVVVVPSARLRSIARELWRLDERAVRHVPNGIDLERFAPAGDERDLRAELGVDARSLVVGFVGHLRAEKNPQRLLAACEQLAAERPVELLLLGEGPEEAALRARAALGPLAGHVHLVGHQGDPAPWYRAMDVFALSSDTEQMPVALLEAMACERCVVSTAVGDVAEMLPEEQGSFVVSLEGAATATALARALRALAADAALRARLGAANRRRVVERYGFERMLRAYEAAYAAALEA